jgi:hypothetical protein
MKARPDKRMDNLLVIDTTSRWFNFVMIFLCFIVLLSVRTQTNHGTTGDEPHYLIRAHSLVHDGDLSLTNNYKNKDFREFYAGPTLNPQGVTNVEQKYVEKGYSSAGAGLPVFVAPGYLMAKKTGAVFTMVMLAVLVVYLTWLRTKKLTNNRKLAYLAAAALVICYFFNGLVGILYPDMLIAAIILSALILVGEYYTQQKYRVLLGLLLGLLVIIHFKSLIIVGPVLAILVYKLWARERKLPWETIAIVIIFVAYYFFTLNQWFGAWNLSSIQDGQPFNASPIHNIPAMLFDANRGLFIYNPVTLLVVFGLPIWYKLHRSSLLETLIVIGPVAASLAIIPNWTGSASPTGRYLVEFLPALIPAVAFGLLALKKAWQKMLVVVIATVTFLISLDAALSRFDYIDGDKYITRPELFAQIETHTGWAFDRLLPLFSSHTTLVGQRDWLKVLAFSILLLSIFCYGWFEGREIERPKQGKKLVTKKA